MVLPFPTARERLSSDFLTTSRCAYVSHAQAPAQEVGPQGRDHPEGLPPVVWCPKLNLWIKGDNPRGRFVLDTWGSRVVLGKEAKWKLPEGREYGSFRSAREGQPLTALGDLAQTLPAAAVLAAERSGGGGRAGTAAPRGAEAVPMCRRPATSMDALRRDPPQPGQLMRGEGRGEWSWSRPPGGSGSLQQQKQMLLIASDSRRLQGMLDSECGPSFPKVWAGVDMPHMIRSGNINNYGRFARNASNSLLELNAALDPRNLVTSKMQADGPCHQLFNREHKWKRGFRAGRYTMFKRTSVSLSSPNWMQVPGVRLYDSK